MGWCPLRALEMNYSYSVSILPQCGFIVFGAYMLFTICLTQILNFKVVTVIYTIKRILSYAVPDQSKGRKANMRSHTSNLPISSFRNFYA